MGENKRAGEEGEAGVITRGCREIESGKRRKGWAENEKMGKK